MNMSRLKNIKKRHLLSQKKLATRKQKLHAMEIWRQTLTFSVSMSKLKNITKKQLQLKKKLPAREQKLHAVNTKENLFFYSVNL